MKKLIASSILTVAAVSGLMAAQDAKTAPAAGTTAQTQTAPVKKAHKKHSKKAAAADGAKMDSTTAPKQ